MMEQTISSVDVYDTSSGIGTLQGFFNDPNSAIIFILGIFVSSIFLIAVTKVMYGPKKKPKPKPVPMGHLCGINPKYNITNVTPTT